MVKKEVMAMESIDVFCKVVRSNRKTMAIKLTMDGKMEIQVPLKTSIAQIAQFLADKKEWIGEHQLQIAECRAKQTMEIRVGSSLQVAGKAFPIREWERNTVCFSDQQGCWYVPAEGQEHSKDLIKGLYKQMLLAQLEERVPYYVERMGVHPAAVKVTMAQKQWGSCSGKNSLNFSWRLAMAPPEALDYIIVHELAHTLEHNHSARFWEIVEKELPDFLLCEGMLKELSYKIGNAFD